MLINMGISNVKSTYDKWGQNKIHKISWLKAIVDFIGKNI